MHLLISGSGKLKGVSIQNSGSPPTPSASERTTEGLPWFLRCQWKSCFFSTWGKLDAEDCFDCRALQRKAFWTCCWPSCTVRSCEWIDGLGPKYIWERMVLAIIIPWNPARFSAFQPRGREKKGAFCTLFFFWLGTGEYVRICVKCFIWYL